MVAEDTYQVVYRKCSPFVAQASRLCMHRRDAGATRADDRRGLVIEHLCIRMYWNLGDESHEHLFSDSH